MAPAPSRLRSVGLSLLANPRWFLYAALLVRAFQCAHFYCCPPFAALRRNARAYRARNAPKKAQSPVSESLDAAGAAAAATAKKGKVAVDMVFFRRLWALLKIAMPGLLSPEFVMLVVHSGFLVLRTWLSVLVADLDGRLVKNLVTSDGKGFIRGLGLWFGIAIPATFTNSMVFQSLKENNPNAN